MKKTRTIHRLYQEWQKLPSEIKNSRYFARKCLVGKWHYSYENENGKIGLVRLNYDLDFFGKNKNVCYETCGTLDFTQFPTLAQAEDAIYKKLGEKYINKKINNTCFS